MNTSLSPAPIGPMRRSRSSSCSVSPWMSPMANVRPDMPLVPTPGAPSYQRRVPAGGLRVAGLDGRTLTSETCDAHPPPEQDGAPQGAAQGQTPEGAPAQGEPPHQTPQ